MRTRAQMDDFVKKGGLSRWTKQGKSLVPPRGIHALDMPSTLATEVKVPHSCATTPFGVGSVSAPKASAPSSRIRPDLQVRILKTSLGSRIRRVPSLNC